MQVSRVKQQVIGQYLLLKVVFFSLDRLFWKFLILHHYEIVNVKLSFYEVIMVRNGLNIQVLLRTKPFERYLVILLTLKVRTSLSLSLNLETQSSSSGLETNDELNSRRITRIITNDFPRYFALITRLRQEAHFIDEQGGLLTSTVIPSVQAHIPDKALQKRIRVSLHVLPIAPQFLQRIYGTRVHVSPVVTVEPRRRKFHKPITLTIPLPTKRTAQKDTQQSQQQQHGSAYTSDSQTLRLLCSITGGTHAAQFDDITGHTPLTFSNDCATFTTTVSARFWLVDAQGVPDILKLAHEIYREATAVPYMSRLVVFAKRNEPNESLMRMFCITDDKENKTLEMQEHFIEIAKSKEVEVVNGNSIYVDLQSSNLQTITKTNEQLVFTFRAFRENRLPCVVRIRDPQQEPIGRLIFSKDNGKLTALQRTTQPSMTNGHPPSTNMVDPQTLQIICNLNIVLPPYDKVKTRQEISLFNDVYPFFLFSL